MSPVAIEIRDLWVTYTHQPVLEDVTLDIKENACVGVLGPNGAGKSTLLKVILGLIIPTRGKVLVFGEDPHQGRSQGNLIGYLPQRPLTNPRFPVSVLDVVLMGRYGRIGLGRRPSREDRRVAWDHLARLGITDVVVVEMDQVGSGSSSRSASMLSLQFCSDELGARMAKRSYARYMEFEEEIGVPIDFRRTGWLSLPNRLSCRGGSVCRASRVRPSRSISTLSRLASTSRARSITSSGTPASRATWMP